MRVWMWKVWDGDKLTKWWWCCVHFRNNGWYKIGKTEHCGTYRTNTAFCQKHSTHTETFLFHFEYWIISIASFSLDWQVENRESRYNPITKKLLKIVYIRIKGDLFEFYCTVTQHGNENITFIYYIYIQWAQRRIFDHLFWIHN